MFNGVQFVRTGRPWHQCINLAPHWWNEFSGCFSRMWWSVVMHEYDLLSMSQWRIFKPNHQHWPKEVAIGHWNLHNAFRHTYWVNNSIINNANPYHHTPTSLLAANACGVLLFKNDHLIDQLSDPWQLTNCRIQYSSLVVSSTCCPTALSFRCVWHSLEAF